MCKHMKYMCPLPENGVVVLDTQKNPHFDSSHAMKCNIKEKDKNKGKQDGPPLESSSYLNVSLTYLGPWDHLSMNSILDGFSILGLDLIAV